MNLVFKPKQNINSDDTTTTTSDSVSVINLNHLHFSEPVQNAVINDSYFIRMIFSDNDVSLMGLMLPMYFNSVTVFKSFNKNIIIYDLHSHRNMISKICDLEFSILEKYNIFLKSCNKKQKNPVYNLTVQLRSCNIKLFDDIDKHLNDCNIVLKISGMWENNAEIGITFKFILLC
jgi:hypothetical protein